MYVSQITDVIERHEPVIVSGWDRQNRDVIECLANQMEMRIIGVIGRKGFSSESEKGSIPLFNSYDAWCEKAKQIFPEPCVPKLILFFNADTIFEELEALIASNFRTPKIVIIGDNIPMASLKKLLKLLQTLKVAPVILPAYLLGYHAVYALQDAEKMAWHYHHLDPDLEAALEDLQIASGSFLDLGTGAGNQAIELAARGFTVTATDLTRKAFAKNAALHPEVEFIEDDILHTRLTRQYDYIFDRGCFHSLELADAANYIRQVMKLLKTDGRLFLKSIYEDATGPKIPNSAALPVLVEIFKPAFTLLTAKKTIYHASNIEVQPKAYFFIMKKNSEG